MKRVLVACLLGLLAVAFAVHCENTNDTTGISPTHNNDDNGGSDGNDIQVGDTGSGAAQDEYTGFADKETETESAECDAKDITIKFVPTRMVILQDFSGSMGGGMGSKWSQARVALTNMLNNPANAAIEFGIDGFPMTGGLGCGVPGHIIIDAAPNQQASIVQSIAGISIGQNALTPLCKVMLNYDPDKHPGYAPKFMADGAQLYLLIVSDGEDTCGDSANPGLCGTQSNGGGAAGSTTTPAMLSQRTADILAHGVHTYVIGFGGGGSMPQQLNAIAAAGGTERKTYIDVSDQAGLQTALNGIAATVASCVYTIDKPDAAADPEKVNFLLDGQPINRDDACTQGGWRWVEKSDAGWKVEFCGATCDKIKTGGGSKVSAVFGCPTHVAPQV